MLRALNCLACTEPVDYDTEHVTANPLYEQWRPPQQQQQPQQQSQVEPRLSADSGATSNERPTKLSRPPAQHPSTVEFQMPTAHVDRRELAEALAREAKARIERSKERPKVP